MTRKPRHTTLLRRVYNAHPSVWVAEEGEQGENHNDCAAWWHCEILPKHSSNRSHPVHTTSRRSPESVGHENPARDASIVSYKNLYLLDYISCEARV